MKKTNTIAAMIAAMTLAACVAVPMIAMSASATNVTVDTSKDNNTTHTYSAYQIFKGTYDENLGLTITGFGNNYNGAGLVADTTFKGLVITPADNTTDPPTAAVTVGDFLGTKTDAASVAQAIEKLNYTDGTSEADQLATILQKFVGTDADKTLSNEATDLGDGYWLVTDSYNASSDESSGNNNPNAVSKYLLKVSGGTEDIQLVPKKDYPTVLKKVKENTNVDDYTYTVGTTEITDADYNDVADYNIGDSVPFKLYGTMPSTYADYEHYYYCFTDTLGSQFTMPATTGVTVKVVNPDGADEGEEADVTTLTAGTHYTVGITGQKLTVTFMDTTKVASITKDSVITVEYSAVLNSNAVIGLNGQENKVDLEYSNNPSSTGDGTTKPDDTDKTPEDKVIVFTYEQDIKKVDAATGEALENAVFNLYKKVSEDVEGTPTEVTYYVQVDSSNKVTGWTADKTKASDLTTGADGICKVIGLDDGTYYLTEKTAPANYNKLNGKMTLTIAAETENGQEWDGVASSALTGIALTASGEGDAEGAITDISSSLAQEIKDAKGTVMAKVDNQKGIHLPSTGGMGTKLFIAGGGLTAVLAGVYLVSKKRTKEEDAQ